MLFYQLVGVAGHSTGHLQDITLQLMDLTEHQLKVVLSFLSHCMVRNNSYLDTFFLFHHERIRPWLFIFLVLKHPGEFDQVGHQVHHRHDFDQFSLQMLDMSPGLCRTVYLICFLYFIFKLNCFQFQHFQNLKIVAAWQINQIFDTNFGNFFYKLLLQN